MPLNGNPKMPSTFVLRLLLPPTWFHGEEESFCLRRRLTKLHKN
jgi:hypothetical protein